MSKIVIFGHSDAGKLTLAWQPVSPLVRHAVEASNTGNKRIYLLRY